jgi:membrane protein implicated in regulation of membrane protease activity
MGKNWPALLMLIVVGAIYGVVGVPWANAFGHWWISIVFYAALVLAALYCRCNQEPIHSKVFHRKVRRTPQSL